MCKAMSGSVHEVQWHLLGVHVLTCCLFVQGKALYMQHETEVLAGMISAAWAKLVSLPAGMQLDAVDASRPAVMFCRLHG